MKINVVWLSYYPEVPAQDYWDMTMIKDIFAGRMWRPAGWFEFEDKFSLDDVSVDEGAIVIIPARYHSRDIDRINSDLSRLPWVVLFIVGDEESTFPTEQIKHSNMKLWVMTPIPGKHKADHFLPHGYTPDCRPMLKGFREQYDSKHLAWFFAGQVTHKRRGQCIPVLESLYEENDSFLCRTPGFAQGLSHDSYFAYIACAKVIPCPSGPATPDSFRVCEALEAGCIPVADECTPRDNYPARYWQNVFGGEVPFYIIRDWNSFPGYLNEIKQNWPENANHVFSWWMAYKRKLAFNVKRDLESFGNKPNFPVPGGRLTVLIPTSPIESHPDTAIIEETVKSIRYWHPSAEIFVLIDGVREELSHYRDRYSEYIRRLLWKCNHEWENVLPIIFDKHMHQVGMTRAALEMVETPLILFVEHDTPLVTKCDGIEWENITNAILRGHADMVRFHYDTHIYDHHQYLMLDKTPIGLGGVRMVRTIQWSQRPHLASASFYRRILRDHFSENALTMIEDRMHSVVQVHYSQNPETGWNDYRLAIYAPDGNMLRSCHTDGRKSDSKFEDRFKY